MEQLLLFIQDKTMFLCSGGCNANRAATTLRVTKVVVNDLGPDSQQLCFSVTWGGASCDSVASATCPTCCKASEINSVAAVRLHTGKNISCVNLTLV